MDQMMLAPLIHILKKKPIIGANSKPKRHIYSSLLHIKIYIKDTQNLIPLFYKKLEKVRKNTCFLLKTFVYVKHLKHKTIYLCCVKLFAFAL